MPGKVPEDTPVDIETQPLMKPSPLQHPGNMDRILVVSTWMFFSAAIIIYNKWLFTHGGFPYPLALTSMHMFACFVVFGTIRKLAPQHIRLAVMPDADVVTSWGDYLKYFLSISLFYAGTLGTGQMAYLTSSVPFVQMMKPMSVIFASMAAFIIGVETPTFSHMIIVGIIFFGVAFASHSSAQFNMVGCLFQVCSSVLEGFRLAMVQCVTTRGNQLDPVSTVYYFSFASGVLLAAASFATEWPLNLRHLVSPWALVINCAMAVLLNVLAAAVIKKTSAVVFALAGVVKDMSVIVASSMVFVNPITKLALCGYSVSLSGMLMYKTYKDNFELFKEKGFLEGMRAVILSSSKENACSMAQES